MQNVKTVIERVQFQFNLNQLMLLKLIKMETSKM